MTAQEILKQAKGHLDQSISWLEMAKTRQTEVLKDLVSDENIDHFEQTIQETKDELYKCSVLKMKLSKIEI